MKEVYSLNDLVEEIFGSNEGSIKSDNDYFQANYKELQRIDKILRGNSDYSVTKGILAHNKEKYVRFVKEIVNNPEIKKSLKKFSQNKNISNKDIKNITEIYCKCDEDIKNKVQRYNDMHKKAEIMQARSITMLQSIIEYFDTDLLFVEEKIFNETMIEIEKLTNEYEEKMKLICEEATKKCQSYDLIDDQIATNKFIKALIPSIEYKKYIDKYNKALKMNNKK